MAADLEKLAREFKGEKFKDFRSSLLAHAGIARQLGAPESFVTDRVAVPAVKTPESVFEIRTVSEELYLKTREALAGEGLTFIVAINPESIDQLRINKGTKSLFDYINPSEKMRSNVPSQMELAIDPNNFRIEGSNNLPTNDQFEKIREREAILKGKLPKDVGDVIGMLRPKHASILAQLDFEHQKRTGKVLFTNWFGRTDDQTVPGIVADVGRGDPTYRLGVGDWVRGHGGGVVFAVSAVVLPRKLVV